MSQVSAAVGRITAEVEINVACSLGILTAAPGARSSPPWACTATTTTWRRPVPTSGR